MCIALRKEAEFWFVLPLDKRRATNESAHLRQVRFGGSRACFVALVWGWRKTLPKGNEKGLIGMFSEGVKMKIGIERVQGEIPTQDERRRRNWPNA